MLDCLAIGELNVDLVMTGLNAPPALGQEVFGDGISLMLGSSTAISACAMAALGMKVGFYGKLGRDAYGQVVNDFLHKYKVDTGFIETRDDISTGITVSLSCGADRALSTYMGGSINGFAARDVPQTVVYSAKHLHVGSYFMQPRLHDGLAELFGMAKKRGIASSLDAGWAEKIAFDETLKNVLRVTDIFFPNEHEAMAITGEISARSAARRLAEYCAIAVVKCGAQGALLVSGKTEVVGEPFKSVPIDTTGAGDTFNAGFLYAYKQGKPLADCLTYGNAAGSISVTRVGGTSACPTLSEVESLIK